jgi:hypothetical protein
MLIDNQRQTALSYSRALRSQDDCRRLSLVIRKLSRANLAWWATKSRWPLLAISWVLLEFLLCIINRDYDGRVPIVLPELLLQATFIACVDRLKRDSS